MIPPAAVLMDIEGTTTPIAFVHDVLFPYARKRLPGWCKTNCTAPVIDAVAALAPGQDVVQTLLGWMDRDEKITPLKTIQGMIWAEGYASGEIKGNIYPDIAPALRRWSKAGLRLFVYSSGSVDAQKLLFGHSTEGDLTPLFQGFFDTFVGPKRAAKSYTDICRGANISAHEFLFLSDVEAELDAAAASGLRTCQLVRPHDNTIASTRHAVAANFAEVAPQFGLPRVS
ncbi:MAG: acireductone synthase [Acidocella sp. 20-57-95]|nr:MAG: acireductone synthase [Acidocella sp. 20-57-95]OYV62186.1 MAG: acireductone synthase [Acidocella sp. 21-58-7]HQT63637.1 acireductone synthase [Acidocella sp.]HQU04010.1 acireductone synthase [Acidocella sp.]